MNKKQYNILFLFIIGVSAHLYAQDINRNVMVVKPYEPTLSDAYKIATLPKFEDTSAIVPSFEYSILTTRIDAPFELKPINAAKMIGTPMEKLYKSYLKLGIGNYFTPLAEFNFNSLRSKDHSFGVFYMHKSSGRKLELNNGNKVPAGYSVNKFELYGKKYYKNMNLSGKLRMSDNRIHYYGYNTALFTDSFPDISGNDIRQNYTHVGAAINLNSAFTDSTHLNYNLGLDYGFTSDKNNNHESNLTINAGIHKLWNNMVFGLDMLLDYINPSLSIDSSSLTVIGGSPYFSKKNMEYNLLIGGRIFSAFGNENKVYLYPRAYLQFNVVQNVILPYVGIDGGLLPGTFYDLISENPYIAPGTNPQNTDKLYVYAGIKGLLSSKSGFNANVSYNIINNMGFFVNDSTGEWDNYFGIIYDDVELFKYSGEIYFDPLEGLHLMLKGDIYSYTLSQENKPWHKPSFNLTFNTNYNIKDKILVTLNLLTFGTRYAKPHEEIENPIKLDPILDLNLGLEYRYSKILSGFINLYNLTSSKYYYWNQYPAQKLNLIVGFTYKL